MADHEQSSVSSVVTHQQQHGVGGSDRHNENGIHSERTPPDGDSPAPSPPPRPSAKKWVRFDESAPASIDDHVEQSASSQGDNGTPEMATLSKPTAPPRRSNPQQQGNGAVTDGNGTRPRMNGGNPSADVAQISVSLEETRRPTKTTAQQESQNNEAGSTREMTSVGSEGNRYENGKVITEKKSENKHCAWVTIARFDPYKMPKSLISDHLTMPVEDYVTAMEMLTNDFRFRSYTVLYRRLIAGWLVASLFILMIILLSGLHGLKLFGLVIFWLILTCGGVVACLFIKKQINKGLHNCVASVNKLLIRYKIMVGLEDRGRMSCHKVLIPFVYFDPKDCIPRIKQLLAQYNQTTGNSTRDIPSVTVDVDPPATQPYNRAATPEEKAEELILKFSQSYVRAIVRRMLRFPSRPSEGVRDEQPLHCAQSYCLCQYLRKYYFERPARKWYHRFCLDSDLPAREDGGFASTVVAYGYPPVVYG